MFKLLRKQNLFKKKKITIFFHCFFGWTSFDSAKIHIETEQNINKIIIIKKKKILLSFLLLHLQHNVFQKFFFFFIWNWKWKKRKEYFFSVDQSTGSIMKWNELQKNKTQKKYYIYLLSFWQKALFTHIYN